MPGQEYVFSGWVSHDYGNNTPEGRAANRRVELVVLADVGAALSDIANGADPPVGEIDPPTTPTTGGA